MKNFFKLGFVALALSLSVVACNSEKKADATDSPAVDSSALSTDSNKVDSAAAPADTTVKPADTTVKH